MSEKAALRKTLRALHQGREERDLQSLLICRHILDSDLYRNARVIGGYMPLVREADVTPVLMDVLSTGRTLALPLCAGASGMTLRRITALDELQTGHYGILEPVENTETIPVDALDLLLVPLEGIDPTGMRLGKGGGYYDRLLETAEVMTLGCALSWQWTAHIPAQRWDRPLRACADMNGVRLFTNSK
ncbi:MAG: 5-formyltetrahydrofolate cyclo-ligase [Clostridia bacterium]|nr:5-formyltetrahydrofolate cyclo-ligase [Clostridia bacterium]